MVQKEKVIRSLILGSALALFVLVSGFGMMFLLYNKINYPKGLLGLFDYKAATWGDGICLPILSFCLGAFIYYNKDRGHKGKKITCTVVILAILLAIFIQCSWLWSDKTKKNWSIPRIHHFNLAGWYHALFFVMMFGIIAYGICRVILQVKGRKECYTIFEQVLFGGMIASGGAFWLLHCFDDYSSILSINYMFPAILLLVMIIIFVMLKITKKEENKKLFIAVSYGILVAFSFTSIAINIDIRGDVFIAFGTAVCSCFIIWKERESLKKVITVLVASVPYFIISYYASTVDMWAECFSIALFMLIVSLVIEKQICHKIRFHTVPMALLLGCVVIQKAPEIIATIITTYEKMDIGDVLFYLSLSILFERVISNIFKSDVIGSEVERNNGIIDEETLKKRIKVAYFKIVVILLGIIGLLCRWGIGVATASRRAENFSVGEFGHSIYLYLGCITCLGLFALSKVNLKKMQRQILVIVLTVLSYIFIIFNSWLSMQRHVFKLENITVPQIILLTIIVFAVVMTPVLTGYGFKINLNDLRNREEKIVTKLSVILVGLGLILSFSNAILLVLDLSWGNIFLVLFNVLFMCEIIPLLCTYGLKMEKTGRKISEEEKDRYVVLNEPYQGVMQDGLSATLLQIFGVGVPCVYIGFLQNPDINGWVSLAGIMIPGMIVVEFFLRNNVGHVERQEKVLEISPDEEGTWKMLRKSLKWQNIIAIIATFPFCICKGIIQSSKAITSGKVTGIRELKEYLISAYVTKRKK